MLVNKGHQERPRLSPPTPTPKQRDMRCLSLAAALSKSTTGTRPNGSCRNKENCPWIDAARVATPPFRRAPVRNCAAEHLHNPTLKRKTAGQGTISGTQRVETVIYKAAGVHGHPIINLLSPRLWDIASAHLQPWFRNYNQEYNVIVRYLSACHTAQDRTL